MSTRAAAALAPALFGALALLVPSRAAADVDDEWDDPKPPAALGFKRAPGEGAEDARVAFRRLERQVTLGPRGSISREAVAGTVRQHLGEVRFCFARAQAQNPALSGRINVKFIVGLDGQVLGAVVESSTFEHEPTERCVTAAVRRWTFPRATIAPVVLTHPFTATSL